MYKKEIITRPDGTKCVKCTRINVVERIENLGFEIIIADSRCSIRHNTDHSVKELFHSETLSSKIDSTYDVVVQFIKNQQRWKTIN